jgi:hypothetical protein
MPSLAIVLPTPALGSRVVDDDATDAINHEGACQ